jgi:CubicO group peptidase (beta-lactamase class C family)
MIFNEESKDKIDDLFKEYTGGDSPGCVIGIISKGDMVFKKGYGMANLEYMIPIISESIFCIASNSKQFTGMCIALLEEEALLNINDNINKYIPEFPHYENEVTISNLLYHTSGIMDYYIYFIENCLFNDNGIITEDEAINFILNQGSLSFEPGEQYSYSNSNYVLLSLVINRITGKSLGEYADERIFKVLGMKNTFFREIASRIIKNRAVGYCVNPLRNSESKYFSIRPKSSDK